MTKILHVTTELTEPRRRRTGLKLPFQLFAAFFGLLLCGRPISAQDAMPEWLVEVRADVKKKDLAHALSVTEQRISKNPADLEAHGWRARLLGWAGRWTEAETAYRYVLSYKPDDVDMLASLADVLHWQGRSAEALEEVDRARALAPHQSDLLVRKGRILTSLGKTGEARAAFRDALAMNPADHDAQRGLDSLASEYRYQLRVGTDIDSFNYADTAATESVALNSRWNRSWSSNFAVDVYQRFGQRAGKFTGSVTRNLTRSDWVSVGSSVGHDQGIIPRAEAFFEYGHGMRFQNAIVRGFETSYDQHWFWYQNARILTLGGTGLFYLPGEWGWLLAVTAARSEFSNAGSAWQPNGRTRLTFPLLPRRLSGNISFAVGSETFAEVDQTGHFAARTFGGGLRYVLTNTQDVSGYVAVQGRSQGRSQTSAGVGYEIRF